jgi:hypothetical protein
MLFIPTKRKTIFPIDAAFQEKGLIPPYLCDALVRATSKRTFSTAQEIVDGKPLYQVNVMENGKILDTELWVYCSYMYDHIIKPKIKHMCTDDPYFVFVKRYRSDERVDLPMHNDQNLFTVSILLTDVCEFEGGDFYILDSRKSNYINNQRNNGRINFDRFVKKNHHLFTKLKYDKGDMIAFEGMDHLHGVLPLTKGERYVLTYFISYISETF